MSYSLQSRLGVEQLSSSGSHESDALRGRGTLGNDQALIELPLDGRTADLMPREAANAHGLRAAWVIRRDPRFSWSWQWQMDVSDKDAGN
jgi:hypothetical protein